MSHSTPTEKAKILQSVVLEKYRDTPNFSKIAREMNLSIPYVRKLYSKALKAIIAPDVEELRKVEGLRLDKLYEEAFRVLTSFHPVINNGCVVRTAICDENDQPIKDENGEYITERLKDTTIVLKSIDRLLRIAERRAHLYGLNAPTKTAFTDPTGKEVSSIQFYIPNNGRDDLKD